MALNTATMSASAQAYYNKTQEEKKKAIQQAATPQAQQAQYNSAMSTPQPSTPVSTPTTGASYTAPTIGTAGAQPKVNTPSYTPNPIAPNLTADQSSYFDKTYGGIDNYVGTQQGRYDTASAQGDTDMLAKLNADASRVGYAFKPYQQPVPMPATVQQASYTAQPYMQLSPQQIQQEASYTINKERSDLQTAADKQSTAIRDNAAYANKLLNDSRVLGDVTRTQTANPFANLGRTSFNEGLVGRQREIENGQLAAGLTNELNAIQQDLYNFDKLAPDKQRMLINEMTRIERQYGLEEGQLMGTFNGQRTLAGQAQDYAQSSSNPANIGQNIQNQISQLNLNNAPEQIRLGLDALKQEVATGNLNQQEAEYKLKELTDPNSTTNQMKNLELEMARLEAANLPETQRLELQKLRKEISNIGKTTTKVKTEAEILADKVKIAEYTKKLSDLESGVTEAPKFNTSLANTLKNQYTTKNSITGQESISDPAALRAAIIASTTSDEETDQMLIFFGLPINQ